MTLENSTGRSQPVDNQVVRYPGHATIGEILLDNLQAIEDSEDSGKSSSPKPKLVFNGGGVIEELFREELGRFPDPNSIPVLALQDDFGKNGENDFSAGRFGLKKQSGNRRRESGRARAVREVPVFSSSKEGGNTKDFRFVRLAWREGIGDRDGYLSSDKLNLNNVANFVNDERERLGLPDESTEYMKFTLEELKHRRTKPGFAVELFGSANLGINGHQYPIEAFTASKSAFDGRAQGKLSVLYLYRELKTEEDIVLIGFYERGKEGEHLGGVLAALYNPENCTTAEL